MASLPQTVLVRVSGPDRPGLTASLMALLDRAGATVQDVEQVVVRRRLTLALAVEVPDDRDVLKELLLFGWEHRVEVDFEIVEAAATVRSPAVVVTVMAPDVGPGDLGAVAGAIAGAGGNIDRIVRLSRYPVVSYELVVTGGDPDGMRHDLLALADERGVDVAVQRDGLGRRAKRLVVLDVDSTLIQDEVIELLADHVGCGAQVRDITARAMAGELDFEAALRERVGLLAGLPESELLAARDRLRLTPGARTFVRTLRRLGYKLAIVSGGFTVFTEALRVELRLDHAYANQLEIVDGVCTGRLVGEIVDRERKAELLGRIAAQEGILVEQTVAVGDGANDIDMLAAAGLGIAFNAKPVVNQAADTAVRVPYLDAVLFLLGVSREEVEAADEADLLVNG